MSYYRNLNKVVSSHLFSKPNNFIYTSCFRPVYLQQSGEENIEYVHSLKALLRTINELESLRNNTSNYSELISKQLTLLNEQKSNYATKVKIFVQKNGLLTAQGIANLYYAAEKLAIPADWLQHYVLPEVPKKCQYMTRENLQDTLEGLKNYHRNSPYISQLEQQLAKHSESTVEYVVHQPNETVKFEYGANCSSNHALISLIRRGSGAWSFQIWSYLYHLLHANRYVLHSE